MCDNWDFAFTHARGRFIAYLSDDDGLLPDSLSYAYELVSKFNIELLVWPFAYYQHPDIPDPKHSALLSCDFMTGRLFEVASDSIIRGLFDFQQDDMIAIIPRMHNSVVDRALVERAARVTKRFFVPPFPDYTTSCQMLAVTESYHFVDVPLYILGSSAISNTGMHYDRKGKFSAYTSMYEENLLAGVPVPMEYLTAPYLFATYRFFQGLYPEKFRHAINIDAFYQAMFTELTTYEDHDDVSLEFKELAGYMREHYGRDDVFDRLWEKHITNKQTDLRKRNSNIELLSQRIRDNKTLYRFAKTIKNYVAPARPRYVEFSNVASIYDASRLLQEKLPALAPINSSLHPEPATSSWFLHELRKAQQLAG